MMDLTGTTITWRDLTLYGSAGLGRVTFATLEGWEELPALRQDSTDRPQQHGRFDAPVFGDERHVLVSGRCFSLAERDAVLIQLQASFNFHATDELPLTITHAGRTLTSYARLLRFKPTPLTWGIGFFGWAAEWVCSDPIRYGAPIPVVTGFPVLAGGLEFDLFTDGATPLVRTNACPNPALGAAATGWGGTGLTRVAQGAGWAAQVDGSVSWCISSPAAVGSAGQFWSGSVVVSGPAGRAVSVYIHDGATYLTAPAPIFLTGTPQTVTVTSSAAVTTGTAPLIQVDTNAIGGAWTSGQMFTVTNALLEQVSGVGVAAGTYFDGSSPGGAWTGTPNASTSTQPGGGTDTGFLEYGAASVTGRLVVANPGNEDAWPLFEIAGPVPAEGFDVIRVDTGETLRFVGDVPTGSVLVLDAATGLVLIDGYADRSQLLTIRDWSSVPPGGSAEFGFVPLGAYSAAQLTATVSPGYW